MLQSNVIAISIHPKFLGRAELMAKVENHKVQSISNVDAILNATNTDFSKVELAFIDATDISIDNNIIGIVQAVKQFCHQAYIMVVVSSKARPEVTTFVKKSGANAVLLESEYYITSKPEYI